MTTTLNVALDERSYPIHIGTGILPQAAALIPPMDGRVAFILTDGNTKFYGEALKAVLQNSAAAVHTFHVPPGEGRKSFGWFEKVLDWMLDAQVTRKSVLFAVGGGVIGDLGGFAAASVLRGIDFVQVPTTLLAMVDSSVGGKTGIDTRHGKNLVGAFHQPVVVIADTGVLKTLPAREMRAGYAEAVKHGALGHADFFAWLETNGQKILAQSPAELAQFVETNCKIKADVVTEDEKEAGKRALLNLGHTFGHALENGAGYGGELLHGEAVAVGMVLAAQLSERLGHCDGETVRRIQAHLKAVGLPTAISDIPGAFEPQALVRAMYGDKKAETGGLTFILLRKIGEAFVQKRVAEDDVMAVLKQSIGK